MDTLAEGASALHRLDPRAKLLATLAFIVAVVSFDRYALSALTPFFIYPVVMIALGGLPAGYLARRALLAAPLAALIGVFNPFLDKAVLFHIGPLAVSGGWASFLSIILRSVLTVTAALILVCLTGFNAVAASLMRLGMPRPFVVQLLLFYRYIFVLADEAERMVRARALRSFDAGAMGFRTFISLIGHLLIRTLDRAERVYSAMRSRGFDGRIRVMRHTRIGWREVFFAAGWIAIFIYFRYSNAPLKLGCIIERMLT